MTTRETDQPLQRFIDERASGQLRYPQNLHHAPGHDLPDGLPIGIEERSKVLRDAFPDLKSRAVELMRTSRAWLGDQA